MVLLLLVLAIGPMQAGQAPTKKKPVRKGFTIELGGGFGGIHVKGLDRYGHEKDDFGFEPHIIALGGFINNDIALIWRWKSTYHNTANAGGKQANRFVGTQTLNVQWWFDHRWFLGGGAGVAIFGFGFGSHRDDPKWSVGGALTARLGYAFAIWPHHALIFSLEAVAGFFKSGQAVGHTFNLTWQYY